MTDVFPAYLDSLLKTTNVSTNALLDKLKLKEFVKIALSANVKFATKLKLFAYNVNQDLFLIQSKERKFVSRAAVKEDSTIKELATTVLLTAQNASTTKNALFVTKVTY
jgi:hypothetical protein